MKILVAMSGGVDSSVAALLLQKEGHDVSGLTLRLWSEECIDDARSVCSHLGISHMELDMREDFVNEVIDPFVDTYTRGETPNPCIRCNERVKFGLLLDYAIDNGFDALATGHYARIDKKDGEYRLLRASSGKDQSYVLYHLSQERLSHVLFPLGGLSKTQIRACAGEAGIPVASKPDSQDICFIENHDYAAFVTNRRGTASVPGDIVDAEGNIVGRHDGLINYTVGQRKGLGGHGKAVYVTSLDTENNRVVIGGELFKTELTAKDCRFVSGRIPEKSLEVQAKIRYGAKPSPALLTMDGDTAFVRFTQPQRAVTPGQAVVFYQDDCVLGGGIIRYSE